MSDESVVSDERSRACVYLYRRLDGTVVYVGRGLTPARALSHAGGSHKAALAELIATGKYELQVAGPYPTYEAAAQVEAALISAMARAGRHDLANDRPGDGPLFAPLGVPIELAERSPLPPLTVAEVGRCCKGALIVRNSFGGELEPGRPRIDPLQIDPATLIDNVRRKWLIERHRLGWIDFPDVAPKVVVGAAGPLKRRYVPAAIWLDSAGWADVAAQHLPLDVDGSPGLDARGLRGRLLADASFARMQHTHFIWVDADGVVRSPVPWPEPPRSQRR